jgi:hypothetical protein
LDKAPVPLNKRPEFEFHAPQGSDDTLVSDTQMRGEVGFEADGNEVSGRVTLSKAK